MERPEATAKIKDACRNIALELMKIHPAVPGLQHKETQDELYKVLYELTKQVEIVKKRVIKLESNSDDSTLV